MSGPTPAGQDPLPGYNWSESDTPGDWAVAILRQSKYGGGTWPQAINMHAPPAKHPIVRVVSRHPTEAQARDALLAFVREGAAS